MQLPSKTPFGETSFLHLEFCNLRCVHGSAFENLKFLSTEAFKYNLSSTHLLRLVGGFSQKIGMGFYVKNNLTQWGAGYYLNATAALLQG